MEILQSCLTPLGNSKVNARLPPPPPPPRVWIFSGIAKFYFNFTERAKIMWLFAQLYKNPTDCFLLEVTTVKPSGRKQNFMYG